MTKQRQKVELPPKFEVAQLIALQIGIGLVILYYVLKSEEVKELFKEIPTASNPQFLPRLLLALRIIDALCAFGCIIISGGKLITFYNDMRSFVEAKKKQIDTNDD